MNIQKESSVLKLLPVLFSFFVMGFVDVVGIATNYVKKDFALNDTLANMIPMMVFLWFLVFSIPTGLMMNRIGRRKTVLLSAAITFVAMLVPFIAYSFPVILVAFALLGIGNTILQVSLNPLLTNVVSGEKLTSSLTFGQFIKAIASFLGPIIAAWALFRLGSWQYIFPIFAAVTLLSGLWLLFTPIHEEPLSGKTSSFAECLGLLKDKTILLFFLGIVFVVGIDVGLNTTIPKLLIERCNLPLEQAGYGTSLYFVARTLGAFIGAMILVKVSGKSYFIINIIIAIAAMIMLLFSGNLWLVRAMIVVLGFTIANVFPIIFSASMQHKPDHFNEISGLLIMGICGGAVISIFMGIAADTFNTQTAGMVILLISLLYLFICALNMKKPKLIE